MHVHAEPVHVAIARSEGDFLALRDIEQCSECRRAAQALDEWMVLAEHPDPLVGAEIQMGRLRLEHLETLSLSDALRKIDSDEEEYPRWGLARLLILEARRALTSEDRIEDALRLSTLALYVSARLESEFYGADHILRINFQAIATGLVVLATSLGKTELVRTLETVFRTIRRLLDVLFSRSAAGPPP